MKIIQILLLLAGTASLGYGQILSNPSRTTGANAIDPSGAQSISVLASGSTTEGDLEAWPDFGAVQDFAGFSGNASTGSGRVFTYTDPALPAVRFTFSGSVDTAQTAALANNSYATSAGTALRLQPTAGGSMSLQVDFGTYASSTFSVAGTRQGVEAAGFTLTGSFQSLTGAGVTIVYKDAAGGTLSTQSLAPGTTASAYTGYAVAPGQNPIASILITLTSDIAQPVDAIGLDDLGFSSFCTQMILNGAFETFGGTGRASNWGEAISGQMTYAQETTNPHGGASSQKITVSPTWTSTPRFRQLVTFTTGRYYRASIWLRGSPGMIVQFAMRDQDEPKQPHGVKTIELTTGWQQVTISGWAQGLQDSVPATYSGSLMLECKTPGVFWADDASMVEITRNEIDVPSALSGTIPQDFFGLHMHNPAAYTWPSGSPQNLPFQVFRLWDTNVAWRNLETSKGVWNWASLDLRVNAAVTAGADLVMVLGQTPQWASSNPSATDFQTYPPTNISDWEDYVTELAVRYDGIIKYWEIWNEPDYNKFYRGSVPQLVNLASSAYTILKTVNPNNVVISPGMTKNTGMAYLERYFFEGGDAFCDHVGYHFYPRPAVEVVAYHMRNIRELMDAYGLTGSELWSTEAGYAYNSGNPSIQTNAVSRMQLTSWANGVSRSIYYGYDSATYGLATGQTATLRPSGVAYRETADWLIGASVVKRSIMPDGTWIIELARPGGYSGYAIWHPTTSSPITFSIPAGWGITRKRDISGPTVTSMVGVTTTSITQAPIILENQAP